MMKMSTRIRLLAASGIIFLSVPLHALDESVEFPRLPDALVQSCFECHDSLSAEADLDLETLEGSAVPGLVASHYLEDMLHAVKDGRMPPKDAEQPSKNERDAILEWLEGNLDILADRFSGDPGMVVMPRLTPYEYRNVIRDLSGGVVMSAGRFLPNEGGAGEGFANVGEAQGMNGAQLEKYMEAARHALRYARLTPALGLEWNEWPREPVDSPAQAREEVVNQIIAWYVAQQQKWGEEHRNELNEKLGYVHSAYLKAAWRYRHRAHESIGMPGAELDDFSELDGVELSSVALEKWWGILNEEDEGALFAGWASAWRDLPGPGALKGRGVADLCVEIVTGKRAPEGGQDLWAPDYELAFRDEASREEVFRMAEEEKRWPFRIEIGEAEELFLLCTDAGDGNRGEYGVWQNGVIEFKDGTRSAWEDVVEVVGANSGTVFPFGVDGEGSAQLDGDALGVRPPGTLKFTVPEGAAFFEVELALDRNRSDEASIQALVLKEKPQKQSLVERRRVFGGRSRAVEAEALSKEMDRALRKRNVSEANLTKIGLNAEKNVLASWDRSPLELIGGPWEDQKGDEEEPEFPYHYSVAQVHRNATPEDLKELEKLHDRLESLVQAEHQQLYLRVHALGWEKGVEGQAVPGAWLKKLEAGEQKEIRELQKQAALAERRLAPKAKVIVHEFAERAWRRPVAVPELDLLMQLYQESRKLGYSYDSSIKTALMLVLTSPDFLYRGQTGELAGQGEGVVPLSDHELASRLSFFLWASLPDAELRALADAGTLAEPATLKAQARRMLQDEKAKSLSTDFASQLWGFGNFENFSGPDELRFMDFTEDVRAAMLEEVTLFLDDLFRRDQPLIQLLDAEHTFANAHLAVHYGIPDVEGEAMRRVSVDPNQRGGLAGMGLFLTKTSLPLRTSPVQRGDWVLAQILGRELPAPPADIEPLSEDEKNGAGEDIRAQLEQHRAEASCASCHDQIDPLGIALENFDAIGRWRDRARDGSSLVNSAVSADGQEIVGLAGLKDYLLSREDEVFHHFNRKLLGYALGRSVGPGDFHLLEDMQESLQENDYRLSSLVDLIVTSPQFLNRRVLADHPDLTATQP